MLHFLLVLPREVLCFIDFLPVIITRWSTYNIIYTVEIWTFYHCFIFIIFVHIHNASLVEMSLRAYRFRFLISNILPVNRHIRFPAACTTYVHRFSHRRCLSPHNQLYSSIHTLDGHFVFS